MALVVLGLIKSSRIGVFDVEPSDSSIDGSAGSCVIVLVILEFSLLGRVLELFKYRNEAQNQDMEVFNDLEIRLSPALRPWQILVDLLPTSRGDMAQRAGDR